MPKQRNTKPLVNPTECCIREIEMISVLTSHQRKVKEEEKVRRRIGGEVLEVGGEEEVEKEDQKEVRRMKKEGSLHLNPRLRFFHPLPSHPSPLLLLLLLYFLSLLRSIFLSSSLFSFSSFSCSSCPPPVL